MIKILAFIYKALMHIETQIVSSRIRTWFADSIFCDDNHHSKCACISAKESDVHGLMLGWDRGGDEVVMMWTSVLRINSVKRFACWIKVCELYPPSGIRAGWYSKSKTDSWSYCSRLRLGHLRVADNVNDNAA